MYNLPEAGCSTAPVRDNLPIPKFETRSRSMPGRINCTETHDVPTVPAERPCHTPLERVLVDLVQQLVPIVGGNC